MVEREEAQRDTEKETERGSKMKGNKRKDFIEMNANSALCPT